MQADCIALRKNDTFINVVILDKRVFIKRGMVGTIALGVTHKISRALKRESFTPQKVTIKEKLGKPGFEVFPVVYGGIIPCQAVKNYPYFDSKT